MRDEIIDFVQVWSDKTELPTKTFLKWMDLSRSKFYDWKQRYGLANEQDGKIPRDFWLDESEK